MQCTLAVGEGSETSSNSASAASPYLPLEGCCGAKKGMRNCGQGVHHACECACLLSRIRSASLNNSVISV